MKRKIIFTLLVASLGLMLDSCEKEASQDSACLEGIGENSIVESSFIVKGEKLVNPYSLDVMRQAHKEVSSLKKSSIPDIRATHLYVRFVPKDSIQFAEIEKDTTIFYYSYPLDYELGDEGDYTQPPVLNDYQFPYQYCVFKIGQKIPNVEYQVLDSCFILEETNVYDDAECVALSKSCSDEFNDWKDLESVALRLSGIEPETVSVAKSKWSPSCTLKFYDDVKSIEIPLVGVPVRCRNNLMISHQSLTKTDGTASFDKMSGKADYLIHWKRADFKIRPSSGLDEVKTILVKNVKSGRTFTFYKNTGDFREAWKCASVFRAVHLYYYENIEGLHRPGNDNLTIRLSGSNSSDQGKSDPNGGTSDIHIFNLDRSCDRIYGTTIHELTHIAQYNTLYPSLVYLRTIDFPIIESWSVGVQNYFTKKKYPNYDRESDAKYSRNYTRIVTDILEKISRESVYSNASYTILELEAALNDAHSLTEWRDNINAKYKRNNEKYINAVFHYWINYTK